MVKLNYDMRHESVLKISIVGMIILHYTVVSELSNNKRYYNA